jgi:hypothetical protein
MNLVDREFIEMLGELLREHGRAQNRLLSEALREYRKVQFSTLEDALGAHLRAQNEMIDRLLGKLEAVFRGPSGAPEAGGRRLDS